MRSQERYNANIISTCFIWYASIMPKSVFFISKLESMVLYSFMNDFFHFLTECISKKNKYDNLDVKLQHITFDYTFLFCTSFKHEGNVYVLCSNHGIYISPK